MAAQRFITGSQMADDTGGIQPGATTITPSPDAVKVDGSGETVLLPQGFSFGTAEFEPSGSDLVLTAPNGTQVVVENFFAGNSPPELQTAEGGKLSGDVATRLAGSETAGQVAQAGPQLGAQPIGQVENIEGTVTAIRADGSRVELHVGDPVFQGDILESSEGGGVGVVLADETTFSMAENGRMVLDEMVYDPGSQEGSISMSVLQGVFTFVSGKVAKVDPDAMVLNTPVATIGIRGTQVALDLTEGEDMKVVLMTESDGFVGEVVVTNNGGVQILNVPDQGTQVGDSNTPPEPPRIYQRAEITNNFGGALEQLPTSVGTGNSYGVGAESANEGEEEEAIGTQNADDDDDDDAAEAGEDLNDLDTASGGDGDEDAPPPDEPEVPTDPEELENIDPTLTTAATTTTVVPEEEETSPPPPPPPPPTNQGPTAVDDASSTEENSSISIDVLSNDSDPDGDPLTLIDAQLQPGDGGSVSIVGGQVVFDPGADFDFLAVNETIGVDITYTVSDGQGGTDLATVTGTVTGTNDAPIAQTTAGQVEEDMVLNAQLVATDVDTPLSELTFSEVTGPENGTLSLNPDGSYTYIPDPNYNGEDSFIYQVDDGQGGITTQTVTITIDPESDDPLAVVDVAATDENAAVTINVLANDIDPDGEPLSVIDAQLPVGIGGAVSIVDDEVVFDPGADFDFLAAGEQTTVEITYTIQDTEGGTDTSTATVTITGSNDGPVAVDSAALILEDTSYFFSAESLLGLAPGEQALDADGEPITISGFVGPTHGSITDNQDGTFTYTPDENYNGSDSFQYQLSDGTVSHAFTSNDTIAASQDIPRDAFGISPTDDVADDSLPRVRIEGNVDTADDQDYYSFDLQAGETITLDIDHGFGSGDSVDTVIFIYDDGGNLVAGPFDDANALTGGAGSVSSGDAFGTFTATGGGTFHAVVQPFPWDQVPTNFGTEEDGSVIITPAHLATIGGVLSEFHLGTAEVSFTNLSIDDAGTLTGPDPEGNYSWTPDPGEVFDGDLNINMDVLIDGSGNPISSSLQVGENQDYGFAGEASGDYTLNVSIDPTPASTGFGTSPQTISDADSFAGTVDLDIDPVNDDPVAVADSYVLNEDASLILTAADLIGNDTDVDLDTLAFGGVQIQPQHGSLVDNGDGTFTYTPAQDYNGADTFTYQVTDGAGGAATGTVNLTIDPVNDDPVAVADSYVLNEDASLILTAADLIGNDTDVDLDTLAFGGVQIQPQHGSLADNGDGTFTYTPAQDYNGADTFTYQVTDGAGGAATGTVNLTIDPVNDDPVVITEIINQTAGEGNAFSLDVSANFDDVDLPNDTMTFSASLEDGTNLPDWLSVDPQTGVLSGTPGDGDGAVHSITVVATDSSGATASDTFGLTVDPTNTPPVAVNDFALVGDPGDVITGNVITNDSDADGDTLFLTDVTFDGQTHVFPEGETTITVEGTNGRLTISDDGTYSYVKNDNVDTPSETISAGGRRADADDWAADGVSISAFNFGTAFVSAGGQFDATLADDTASFTRDGVGVSGTQGTAQAANQIEYDAESGTSEALAMTFDTEVLEARVTVDRLYHGEGSTGEQGAWQAFDAAGNLVGSGIINDSTVDYGRTSNEGELTINLDGGTSFQTIVFTASPMSGRASDFQVREIEYDTAPIDTGSDIFAYTISDDGGATDTATLTIEVQDDQSPPIVITGNTPSDGSGTIIGGAGDDILDGQQGDDEFIFHLGDGEDTIFDFEEGDQLTFEDADNVTFEVDGDDVVVNVSGQKDGEQSESKVTLKDAAKSKSNQEKNEIEESGAGYSVTDTGDGTVNIVIDVPGG